MENEPTVTRDHQVGDEAADQNAPTAQGQASRKPSQGVMRGLLLIGLMAALVIGYLIYSGLTTRARASETLQRQTEENAAPIVSITRPKPTAGTNEIMLPGNMQAFVDTPIWARASGYLRVWHADIGARVHKGELLAEIEAPEVDQQLQQAKAELVTAEANLKLAQITAERYNSLFKMDSVAKQDVDNAVQDAAAKTSAVTSSRANVSRLEQLVAYEKVYAPFDGVIVARNVDVGALVDAGANTAGKELFHLAANSVLRVYVSVPEFYSRAAQPGVQAVLTLTEFPGREFHGHVVRNSRAIDMNSRTLLVEVDVNNPTGELLPGSYTVVHLHLPAKVQSVTIPANTLLFRSEGLQAAVVRDGKAQLVSLILGHDYGDAVEVLSGLRKGDAVILDPADSLASGQTVRISNGKTVK